MQRREFLKVAGGLLLTGASSTLAVQMLTRPRASGIVKGEPSRRKWGMLIDLDRCVKGCNACMDACRKENNVASFDDPRFDIHWIRKVPLRSKVGEGDPSRTVILLCNHCDNPPCAQVCPVQATYKRDDGIVIVDHHRCVGCRYCMIACPYNARFFNFKANEHWENREYPKRSHGVAEACTLCAHRLDRGQLPACVEACAATGAKAMLVGDLNDKGSEISQMVAKHSVKRVREDFGTEPKVYYMGL